MKKICTYCSMERDAEKDFNWEYKSRGKRQACCKYCQAELSKLHYHNNKQIYKDRSRLSKAQILIENKPGLYAYLSTHPCVDCGCTDMRLLEFDHVYGQKAREISDMIRQGFNWPSIEVEIAKCEIRCANCHRIKTFERNKNWRSTQYTQPQARSYEQLRAYLSTHPCIDCREKDIRLLEFDHVHGNKKASVSRLLAQGCGWSSIEVEIAKCEVRCANCHRIKTFDRDGDWWKGKMEIIQDNLRASS